MAGGQRPEGHRKDSGFGFMCGAIQGFEQRSDVMRQSAPGVLWASFGVEGTGHHSQALMCVQELEGQHLPRLHLGPSPLQRGHHWAPY